MKKWTLIVGDNPVLLQTRTELLQEWQIVTASSRDAGEAIQARAYDSLIFSQIVLEETVSGLTLRGPGDCSEAWLHGSFWNKG
jgi:CheY-like chemotaxis protein